MENKHNIKLPLTALLLDFASALLFLLADGVLGIGGILAGLLALILILGALLCPVAATVTGIVSLCYGKQKIGKAGIAMAVSAIILPVIAIAVMILLLSTGIARIALM